MSPRARRIRRTPLALALILGPLTTIAVAWFFAARQDMFQSGDRQAVLKAPAGVAAPSGMIPVEVIFIDQTTAIGSRGWTVSFHAGVAYTTPPDDWGPPLTIPTWARAHVMPWETEQPAWPAFSPPRLPYAVIAREIRAHGWPFPALHWRRAASAGPTFIWTTESGFTVPWLKSPDLVFAPPPLVLPYEPIAAGMLINSALFSCAWAILFILPGRARRRRRRRRGACESCAYDLRATAPGAPCPECGAEIAHRRRLPMSTVHCPLSTVHFNPTAPPPPPPTPAQTR